MEFSTPQHHRGTMALTSPFSLDLSSCSSRSDIESPRNRSSSFSISSILSDDIGSQKKSNHPWTTTPTSEPVSDRVLSQTPKRPRDMEIPKTSAMRRTPHITLTEVAGLMGPSNTSTLQVHPSHPVASIGGTSPMHPRQHNSSLSASPFDPSFLHALGQQTSPTEKEDLLSDSLGMLSTVAMYHGELSSSLGTPIQNKMANVRITSSYDGADRSSDWNNGDPVLNPPKRVPSRSRTPSILKRRTRKPNASVGSESSVSGDETVSAKDEANDVNLNTGFLSPLASEKSALNNQQSGFSPSIFLSRPEHSVMSEAVHEVVKSDASPRSDTDASHDDDFTTSTPIKTNKENVAKRRRRPGWSPTILRRRQITSEISSGSGYESEHPVKRSHPSPNSPPTKRHKKSKARTKLSPLLENACSPIPKADYAPSPLTHSTMPTRLLLSQAPPPLSNQSSTQLTKASTAHLRLPQPTQLTSLPVTATTSSSLLNPPLLNLSQPQLLPQLYQSTTAPTLTYPVNPLMPTVSALPHTYLNAMNPMLNPAQQVPRHLLSPPLPLPQQQATIANPYLQMPFYLPQSSGYGTGGYVQMQVMPNLSYSGIMKAPTFSAPINSFGSIGSACSLSGNQSLFNGSFVRRDDSLKSVPPRFIFPTVRTEGKRSRLTEAINKSLSETPSENARLPKEWTKYACGQTNNQKEMTEKARSFIMHCRPRTLNFGEETQQF